MSLSCSVVLLTLDDDDDDDVVGDNSVTVTCVENALNLYTT